MATWTCDDCGWTWPAVAGEPAADAECDACGSSDLTIVCTIPEPHCMLCAQTGVERPDDGYSTCCNKRIVTADRCLNPENHGDGEQ